MAVHWPWAKAGVAGVLVALGGAVTRACGAWGRGWGRVVAAVGDGATSESAPTLPAQRIRRRESQSLRSCCHALALLALQSTGICWSGAAPAILGAGRCKVVWLIRFLCLPPVLEVPLKSPGRFH